MRSTDKVRMEYKKETGNSPKMMEITFESFRDLDVVDYADHRLKRAIGYDGKVEFHDMDYILWLEAKLSELIVD